MKPESTERQDFVRKLPRFEGGVCLLEVYNLNTGEPCINIITKKLQSPVLTAWSSYTSLIYCFLPHIVGVQVILFFTVCVDTIFKQGK